VGAYRRLFREARDFGQAGRRTFKPDPQIQFDFRIAMGVRFGEREWKDRIERLLEANHLAFKRFLPPTVCRSWMTRAESSPSRPTLCSIAAIRGRGDAPRGRYLVFLAVAPQAVGAADWPGYEKLTREQVLAALANASSSAPTDFTPRTSPIWICRASISRPPISAQRF